MSENTTPTKQTPAQKNLAFWQAPTTTEASKVTASIPASPESEDGKTEAVPAREVFNGPANFAALWECHDVAILRSYAFKGLRSAVNTAFQTAVSAGKAEAYDKDAYEAVIADALKEPAIVRGFGEVKALGVIAGLKTQLAEQQAAIQALQDAMASGDKGAIKEAMQALAAIKA